MMRCLAHHIALAFRSTIELVRASREFNRILAFSVAAESMSAQVPGSLLTGVGSTRAIARGATPCPISGAQEPEMFLPLFDIAAGPSSDTMAGET
jgi:hypothetical protein